MGMDKSEVIRLIRKGHSFDPEILLDDGLFFIQHDPNMPADRRGGVLRKHCTKSERFPAGIESIGAYRQQTDGLWSVNITILPGGSTVPERKTLGAHKDPMDAISQLWLSRFKAHYEGS